MKRRKNAAHILVHGHVEADQRTQTSLEAGNPRRFFRIGGGVRKKRAFSVEIGRQCGPESKPERTCHIALVTLKDEGMP